jgi:phosphodiesterase/alkaline phosphatase D-like protein/prolyl oligopeptidase PreP (S9A serine peptidase family)
MRVPNTLWCLLIMELLIGVPRVSIGAPDTPRRPVTQTFQGITATDHYQWLEAIDSSEVRDWHKAQAGETERHLESSRIRRSVRQQFEHLKARQSPVYSSLSWRPRISFLLKKRPMDSRPVLVSLSSLDDLKSEKVVFDPNSTGPGTSTELQWFEPSPDGRFVALCLSSNQNIVGNLHIVEGSTGRPLSDVISGIATNPKAGNLAWSADSLGFFYCSKDTTKTNHSGHQVVTPQVRFHMLGDPSSWDKLEAIPGAMGYREIELKSRWDDERLLVRAFSNSGGPFTHFVRLPNGLWRTLANPVDQVIQVEFGRDPLYLELPKDESFYLLTRLNSAKGRVVRLPPHEWDIAQSRVVVQEDSSELLDIHPTSSGIALRYLKRGTHVFVYKDFLNPALSGPSSRSDQPDFKIPTGIQEIVATRGDELLFRTESYTAPFTWWRFDPNITRDHSEPTVLRGYSTVSMDDIQVTSVTVPLPTGNDVPMSLLHRRGLRFDGERPTLVEFDGGLEKATGPSFEIFRRFWFDQNGVLAIVHMPMAPGTFDQSLENFLPGQFDLLVQQAEACLKWLTRSNMTSSARIALQGFHENALLSSAMLVRRPEMFRISLCRDGQYDLLNVLSQRIHHSAEVSPDNISKSLFQSALNASPYYGIRPNVSYPAAVFTHRDARLDGVRSSQAYKMVAALQNATVSKAPVLFMKGLPSADNKNNAEKSATQLDADLTSFLFDQMQVNVSWVERGPWCGSVTHTSAVVKAKLARPGLAAKLLVSLGSQWNHAIPFGPELSDTNHHQLVAFSIGNLNPDSQYQYALEIDGRLDHTRSGQFRTFPAPGQASFQFAFASCARTGSTRAVFEQIRKHRPLFFLHMGDFHYLNIQTNDIHRFRAAYDRVLASPQQMDLYREVPIIYMWDDHDYGGNSASRKSKTHEAARLAYDEYVPHYPFVRSRIEDPIYQSFSVGRVKFILTDLRSEREDPKKKDTPAKTMLGAQQKAWLKQELLSANGTYPLICWMTSVPWIGDVGKGPYSSLQTNVYGYIHQSLSNLFVVKTHQTGRRGAPMSAGEEDHWSVFGNERREIADFIKANQIRGVCILHGDSHMLAADDGSNADYATGGGAPIPVMCGGPLDQVSSLKGGPYSQGVYRVNDSNDESGFGLITIQDSGDRIRVNFSGRNQRDEEKVSLEFELPASRTQIAVPK